MLSWLLLGAMLAPGQVALPPNGQGARKPAAESSALATALAGSPPSLDPMRTEPPAPTVPAYVPGSPPPEGGQIVPTAADEEAAARISPIQVNLLLPPPLAPAEEKKPEVPVEKRRALPSPFPSPPFPGSEYQGYPLIGVPPDTTRWPLMKLLQGTYADEILDSQRIRLYGWVTWETNLSTSKSSNTPDSYWVRPNNIDMDQALIRLDRNLDSVQTDHIDWGFRLTLDYGIDYRYFTAGGWFSQQLLRHNLLYGWDPTEVYADVYIPWVAQGLIVRVGRWIACPDIETQFAPDNYFGSHSILFTFDTYTQTGIMLTTKLSDQWTVQGVIHSGTDMAPWYPGAVITGAAGVRWVSQDNNDATYTWLNAINSAKFRRFEEYGQELGHDNFNYIVTTWEHRFNPMFVTKTESYFMWQRDAVVGGTPSAGPVRAFGGGGGIGADIPGITYDFGMLNYTLIGLSKRDFITIRNEWYRDTRGERSGFGTTYTSNSIALSHNFTPNIQIRPEISFFRSWGVPAFDNGRRQNQAFLAFDFTVRF